MGIKSKTTFGKYLINGLPTIQVGNSKRISTSDIAKFRAQHRVVVTQDKSGDELNDTRYFIQRDY